MVTPTPSLLRKENSLNCLILCLTSSNITWGGRYVRILVTYQRSIKGPPSTILAVPPSHVNRSPLLESTLEQPQLRKFEENLRRLNVHIFNFLKGYYYCSITRVHTTWQTKNENQSNWKHKTQNCGLRISTLGTGTSAPLSCSITWPLGAWISYPPRKSLLISMYSIENSSAVWGLFVHSCPDRS